MAAAKLMLDEVHAPLSQPRHDKNTYRLGRIADHNVAIACLPSGIYGTTSAAVVAGQMLSTFHSIRFGLMVGIGGGVPSSADIRLGDVVVSEPSDIFPGIVQYDFGKTVEAGRFQRSGTKNKPPQQLLTTLSDVKSNHLMGNSTFQNYLSKISSNPKLSSFHSPGPERDELFNPSYRHPAAYTECSQCDRSQKVVREPRASNEPKLHFGTIASGNQVMKDGETRDRLGKELGSLCFEMEAAGLMDNFPCLVVRGICDYSDTHKNKGWQRYAAVTAAAYTKELLSGIPLNQMQVKKRDMASESFTIPFSSINFPRIPNFFGREQELADIHHKLHADTSNGILTLHGLSGIGRTQLAIEYASLHQLEHSAVFWLDATDPVTLEFSFMEMASRILLDDILLETLKK